jgi:TPR repeat protein
MMYRYQPPKSSIWGHKLRKMHARRASKLLEQFFSRAIWNHELNSVSLGATAHLVALRLAAVLGVPPRDFMHERLTLEQSDACLRELIRLESEAPADAKSNLLSQYFEITQWAINGKPVPCLVAQRVFGSGRHERNRLCKLNNRNGVVDKKSALDWFRLSARQGHYLAQIMLGKMLSDTGIDGALRDPVEGYAWFIAAGASKAAEKIMVSLNPEQARAAEVLGRDYRRKYGETRPARDGA